jgi:hypothetical protein
MLRFRTNWLQIWSSNDPEWVALHAHSLESSKVSCRILSPVLAAAFVVVLICRSLVFFLSEALSAD